MCNSTLLLNDFIEMVTSEWASETGKNYRLTGAPTKWSHRPNSCRGQVPYNLWRVFRVFLACLLCVATELGTKDLNDENDRTVTPTKTLRTDQNEMEAFNSRSWAVISHPAKFKEKQKDDVNWLVGHRSEYHNVESGLHSEWTSHGRWLGTTNEIFATSPASS